MVTKNETLTGKYNYRARKETDMIKLFRDAEQNAINLSKPRK